MSQSLTARMTRVARRAPVLIGGADRAEVTPALWVEVASLQKAIRKL